MIFIILLYGIIAGVFISKRKMKMSQAVIPMIAFAILSSVALGQNYTKSLIPEVNDGIGISNFLATFLLPEDGWTKEMFLSKFELYLGISIALILLYFLIVIVENIKSNVKA
ncbi:hypothetical protein HMPREF1210_01018 [Paenisporosarcina sp. HGH0030]|uniref:hypothetical protein n=1 Tax=Paenisporosarcina sp. HGH0030 TaxID=1078085 RepID=UPI00034EB24A|nr:hypothetical protein [Paenisporosarcina sp. HGH0030]EPD53287.1 hypothetical protein HMPREF1210_01018 [Paenisporosarcina sp. HGH0030]